MPRAVESWCDKIPISTGPCVGTASFNQEVRIFSWRNTFGFPTVTSKKHKWIAKKLDKDEAKLKKDAKKHHAKVKGI